MRKIDKMFARSLLLTLTATNLAYSTLMYSIVAKTSDQSGSGMSPGLGHVDFIMTNFNNEACAIQHVSNFEDGKNKTLIYTTLSPCEKFDAVADEIPFFEMIHSGTDLWRWDYILVQLESAVVLTCSDGFSTASELDGSASKLYACTV